MIIRLTWRNIMLKFDIENALYYKEQIKDLSDYEQSLLWQCMNDKSGEIFHKDLSTLIMKRLSHCSVPLYRGLSKTTFHKFTDLGIGDEYLAKRVYSFSEDMGVAAEFASNWTYGTRTLLKIENVNKAFWYQDDIINILLAAPESEFIDEPGKRGDNLDMVYHEAEWMIPIGSRLKIKDIIDRQIGYSEMTIINVDLLLP